MHKKLEKFKAKCSASSQDGSKAIFNLWSKHCILIPNTKLYFKRYLPFSLEIYFLVILWPGSSRAEYFTLFPNEIFGKSFPFLVFWGRVSSFWQMFLKLFENSNEICKLLCWLYGLRVTFGEEFVCSLWEKFPWFS